MKLKSIIIKKQGAHMSNILKFNSTKKETETMEELPMMTKEDFEFLEDMIANCEMASPEEVDFECDDGFCITKTFEVKVSPSIKNEYLYLQSRNKQKRENHLNNKRKSTLKLV